MSLVSLVKMEDGMARAAHKPYFNRVIVAYYCVAGAFMRLMPLAETAMMGFLEARSMETLGLPFAPWAF